MKRWQVAILAGALTARASSAVAQAHHYVVIVNAENPVDSMSRVDVAKLFLDRTARWRSGGAATPVDQSLTSAVRAFFAQDVLGFSLPALRKYWDKRMMESRENPPPVKSTDAEVIAHVARNKGGIGYISAGAALDPGVKALKLLD